MNTGRLVLALLIGIACLQIKLADATPSGIFWTNCTTDIRDTGTGAIGASNYFTVFKARGKTPFFPPDIGISLGLFKWQEIEGEVGCDYLGGTNAPWFFDGALGVKEDILWKGAPAVRGGMFAIGTQTEGPHRTNFNIVHLSIGKTLPKWLGGGEIFIGGCSGSQVVGPDPQAFMVAYRRSFCPSHMGDKKYFKWTFYADYATGRNVMGGGGIAISYAFSPNTSLTTGPVWFNSSDILGSWKWAVQFQGIFSL